MTPGSPAAIASGCRCDPIRNNGGLGDAASFPNPLHGVQYVVATACLMHGPSAWRTPYVSPRGEEIGFRVTPIAIEVRRP